MTAEFPKARGIIFSAPMIRALLAGTKTETRRKVRLPQGDVGKNVGARPCRYGEPGGLLWVRETWAHDAASLEEARAKHEDFMGGMSSGPYYRATEEGAEISGLKWRPGRHMPRWASRITLEIIDTRCEHLQEITDEGAVAEGVLSYGNIHPIATPRDVYADLWEEMHGKGSWYANPLVWVVRFRLHS